MIGSRSFGLSLVCLMLGAAPSEAQSPSQAGLRNEPTRSRPVSVQCWQHGVKIIDETGPAPGPNLIGEGQPYQFVSLAGDQPPATIVVKGATTCLYRVAAGK